MKEEVKKVTVYMPVSVHSKFKELCADEHTNMAAKFLTMAKKENKKAGK